MGMKLIINENQYKKVNELIYQTIDGMFDIDQMIVEDVADYEKASREVEYGVNPYQEQPELDDEKEDDEKEESKDK